MNVIEAYKKSKYIRRPIAKHLGSNKNGWIDGRHFLENLCIHNQSKFLFSNPQSEPIITFEDLIAEDWEAKLDENIKS